MDDFLVATQKLYALLDLKYKAVGVEVLKDREAFEAEDAQPIQNAINYCGAVRAATRGHGIKISRGKFRCKSAERFFGIHPDDPANARGENWHRLGLYEQKEVSEAIRTGQRALPDGNYGVVVRPLEAWDRCPEVVLIFDVPYIAMRIVQGYGYKYGEPEGLRILGNQAVCYESTTLPLTTGSLNLSLLCIGTRHRAGWAKEDMSVGIPGDKFAGVVEGIEKTANTMEGDDEKRRILSRWDEKSWGPLPLRFRYNYYMDCK